MTHRLASLTAAVLLGALSPALAIDDSEAAAAPAARAEAAATLAQRLAALSAEGRYGAMLELIESTGGADDPAVLNYRGYALRKTGHPAEAVVWYRKALVLDPDYFEARAYLGQGLLDIGDVAGAKAELLEIRARGGRDTLAYATLKNAILDNTGY